MDESGGTAASPEAVVMEATPEQWDRVPALAWLIAAAFAAFELALSGRYGFMQDELYFMEAGRHLAFGYVDQPPLTPLLDRTTTSIFGVSPTAIRIIPALAGGVVVLAAARFAALFGAGRFGQVLAALLMACAPVLISSDHVGNTTPAGLLAWTVTLMCVTTALLWDRPRWWLGAGVAAGLGLEDNNLLLLLLVALVVAIFCSRYRPVLGTTWPWTGSAIAAVLWAPNVMWQAAHGWPQLAMASALHHENSTPGDYAGGLPTQLIALGLLTFPLAIWGFVRLWRTPELRFLAVTVTIVLAYVIAWIPGKVYYADGLATAVLAAGALAAEQWAARSRRPKAVRGLVITAPLAGFAIIAALIMPIMPVADVHSLPAAAQQSSDLGDTIGWLQLTRAVAAQYAAQARAGQRPTSIFTGYYAEAAALDVLGRSDHLPPVLSGHNAYWMWGPGRASDQTVLAVDALAQLRPYFASCQLLMTFNPPYGVRNGWTGIPIGVCTGPSAGWRTLWPHLRHYG